MQTLFPPREPFNAYSHYLGALIAAIWLFFLMKAAAESPTSHKISYLVYGISVILMFLSSGIYHTLNVQNKTEELFRLFDHILIYVLIAGSYTPMCVVALEGGWQWGILLGIWLFALAGILKKTFWMSAPRWFSTVIYLLMGWVSLIILPQVWRLLPHAFVYWIALGGLFYTVGAIIYGIRKPDPIPGAFGFHEIWHLFVLGGAFSHYWAIYKYLPEFNFPA
ncbi:MAG: hemolysin III family protein [Gracilimonas sp.]|uniref:PAQR family membrane homeostasis protein TrhA n=1 Tax=Gracilimonas sp. TaxID=1974203 RepID=UPI0019C12102|nr:hemolysin III family protein [Gracilimonas sp.]MBD3617140.1 hemolysin III family protein [Gracilimonas sp.]